MANWRLLLALAAITCGAAISARADGGGGAELFARHCAACHQADGAGVPGLAPPLVGALKNIAENDQGRTYIAHVLVSGMAGTIRTGAGKFSGVMPSQAALADRELAAIASYVLAAFNDSRVTLRAEEFAALRGRPLPPGEVRKLREQVLARIGGG